MGKYPIYAILAGMLLVLASCIPVAGSLYRMAVPVAPERFELTIDGRTQLDQQVKTAGHIMLVLVFELSPAHMREPGVRYHVVVRNGEQIQQRVSGSVELKNSGHEPEAGAGGPTVRIEERLPVLDTHYNNIPAVSASASTPDPHRFETAAVSGEGAGRLRVFHRIPEADAP